MYTCLWCYIILGGLIAWIAKNAPIPVEKKEHRYNTSYYVNDYYEREKRRHGN